MNAAETVRAAIETLELRRDDVDGGREPWVMLNGPEHEGPIETRSGAVIVGYCGPDEGALIMTLHRTLDAQLAILRVALEFVEATPGAASHSGPSIDLARAVLGDS